MYIKKEDLSRISETVYDKLLDYIDETPISHESIIMLDVLVDYEERIDGYIKESVDELLLENPYLKKYRINIDNEIYDYLTNHYNFDDIKDELIKESLEDKSFRSLYKYYNEVDNFEKEYC